MLVYGEDECRVKVVGDGKKRSLVFSFEARFKKDRFLAAREWRASAVAAADKSGDVICLNPAWFTLPPLVIIAYQIYNPCS